MARKRAMDRDLSINPPLDPASRLKCEADPALWLSTYFPEKVFEGWTEDRLAMVHSIIDAARYGGDQSIAGPRGEGKTTLAILTALYLMIRRLSTFQVVIGKNADKAKKEAKDNELRLRLLDLAKSVPVAELAKLASENGIVSGSGQG